MIHTKYVVVFVVVIFLGLQGCETAKGFKKDIDNTFGFFSGKKSKIEKVDDWIQENMW